MKIQPISFLFGLGVAWTLPVLVRVFRPVAVQATVVGMGVFDEARRVVAEQAEIMEDILAEARARHEEMAAEGEGEAAAEAEEAAAPERRRRRHAAPSRRRAS
jgi:hypothetical protein